MSEPMSNPEIEDVLSSIRRLVSEDLRPGARVSMPVAAHPSDKLLLTPALRIVDTGRKMTAPLPVEDVVSRLGAAVADEDWESPFGDPEVWPGALPPPGTLPPQRPQAGAFVHRTRAPSQDADAPLAGSAPADSSAATEAPPAFQADAARREVTPPPLGRDWASDAEVIDQLAQDIAQEALIWKEDRGDGQAMFDEAVLQDMVRDLIRKELSGALGERITRTVRKHVRAEIARAIALRDFE